MAVVPLNFPPGIQRDGTNLDTECCINGQWTRFRLGRPRSMLGFQQTYSALKGVGRRIHMYYAGKNTYIHVGTGRSLQQIVIDQNGNVISFADRTPQTFPAGPNAGWTLDAIFDTTSSALTLVAHSVPDISVTASTAQTIPYSGILTDTTPLKPLSQPGQEVAGGIYTTPKVAGGIVCVQPYLFDFDINGMVGWSAPNQPNTLGITGGTSGAGSARISAQKIVAGMPLRGGGANSPAALFWSLSEVITAQFIGSPAYFAFNTVSPSSSILSPQSVIEYDNLFFWAGVDRFLVYNGTVVEVPNRYNQDWFFDNLNRAEAGKAFAFKVPRFGEIWFCAPLFGATECSHAVIYNVRENCWYDTKLPDGGRSAGYFAQGYPYPFMTDVAQTTNGYSLWQHETGTDKVIPGQSPIPIWKYYETPVIGGAKSAPGDDSSVSFGEIEPDFLQNGDIYSFVTGSFNAKGGDFAGDAIILPGISSTATTQTGGYKTSRRTGRIHFGSNTLGGNFVAGRHLQHTNQSGDRRTWAGPASPSNWPTNLTDDSLAALADDYGDPIIKGK